MPTQTIYLSEEEYAKLAYLAMQEKIRIPVLIRKIVREHLQKMEVGKGEGGD